jgi:hypothetical protein
MAGSALDDFSIPQRPTGAMTLLRNDLRTEDKNKQQGGWLDSIVPKKPKEAEPESATKPKAAPKPAMAPAYTADDNHLEPKAPKPAPKPASPSRAERIELASTSAPTSAPVVAMETVSAVAQTIPVGGVAYAVAFVLIASLASLEGKGGLLGVLLLVTVGILAASVFGVWNRQGKQKAFWQGFSVFGLGYLAMAFIPTFPNEAGIELPTTRLIKFTHAKLVGSPEDSRNSFVILKEQTAIAETKPVAVAETKPLAEEARPLADAEPVAEAPKPAEVAPKQSASLFSPGDLKQFTVVGQCAFTLIFALIGSALSRWFYQSRVVA